MHGIYLTRFCLTPHFLCQVEFIDSKKLSAPSYRRMIISGSRIIRLPDQYTHARSQRNARWQKSEKRTYGPSQISRKPTIHTLYTKGSPLPPAPPPPVHIKRCTCHLGKRHHSVADAYVCTTGIALFEKRTAAATWKQEAGVLDRRTALFTHHVPV